MQWYNLLVFIKCNKYQKPVLAATGKDADFIALWRFDWFWGQKYQWAHAKVDSLHLRGRVSAPKWMQFLWMRYTNTMERGRLSFASKIKSLRDWTLPQTNQTNMQLSCLHGVWVVLGWGRSFKRFFGHKVLQAWIFESYLSASNFWSPMSNTKMSKPTDVGIIWVFSFNALGSLKWKNLFPTQDFHIVFFFKFFHRNVYFCHKLHKSYNMKTILEKFFPFFQLHQLQPPWKPRLSLSGGTGALQPLPMQISDAERFRDLVVLGWIGKGALVPGFCCLEIQHPPPIKA